MEFVLNQQAIILGNPDVGEIMRIDPDGKIHVDSSRGADETARAVIEILKTLIVR